MVSDFTIHMRASRQVFPLGWHSSVYLTTASHLAGVINTEAVQQSGHFNERTEWHLRPEVFTKIAKIWGVSDIDIFASRLNKQLLQYVSWKPDPGAKHGDVFTFSWTGIFSYIFPPFCLISRCLQKLEHDQALSLFVVPVWPMQVWWQDANDGMSVIREHFRQKEFQNHLPNFSWSC